MRVLVTGSAGHLGEALVRTLEIEGHEVVSLDVLESPFTTVVGSIVDRDRVRECMNGADAVLHAAGLHKPHVGARSWQEFVDVNVSGTVNLLEEAVAAGVRAFVFTSTTSAFGRALVPLPGQPATWITEEVAPVPRNVYGVTKVAAEDLCELAHREHGLSCLVLRTSRFFPEEDDRREVAAAYEDSNVKVNELLYRRVDIADAVSAHLLALERAAGIGFGRYIVSATTPFSAADLVELRTDAAAVVARHVPGYEDEYAPARVEDVPDDRACLRQREGPGRARLATAVRLRLRARAPAGRRGAAERARRSSRLEGLRREQLEHGQRPPVGRDDVDTREALAGGVDQLLRVRHPDLGRGRARAIELLLQLLGDEDPRDLVVQPEREPVARQREHADEHRDGPGPAQAGRAKRSSESSSKTICVIAYFAPSASFWRNRSTSSSRSSAVGFTATPT